MAQIQLTTADVIAIRALRRSAHAAGVQAVLHKLAVEQRRIYEEATAAEVNRATLDGSKHALHLLFTEAL